MSLPRLRILGHFSVFLVGSVRALWRSTRMSLLNSFQERLTTLKTNFAVSGQIYVTMPCTDLMMSYDSQEQAAHTSLVEHPPGGEGRWRHCLLYYVFMEMN